MDKGRLFFFSVTVSSVIAVIPTIMVFFAAFTETITSFTI